VRHRSLARERRAQRQAILGQGDLVGRFDDAMENAVRLSCIDGFTIGFTSRQQLEQVTAKIESVS